MIASLALAGALVLGGAPDPCGPVEPASPDPALAAVYRGVGDAERAAGSLDAALAAYRAALSHDAGDEASRVGLQTVCTELRAHPFEDGVRLMKADELRGAVAAFERARTGPDARSAELLEGICLYRSGDDAAAAPLLRAAELDPAHRENARFFLGLIALRAGRAADAEQLLSSSAAADPALAPFARDLLRSARRTGRLVLSFVAESGWDSNVDLAPDTGGPAGRTPDALGAMTLVADAHPLGESGPFLRGTANWREQATYDALDMRSLGGTAGWQGGRGGRFWLAEYGYDDRQLARAPYMSAHRLFGTARLQLARDLNVGASWLTRFEAFEPAVDAGYSGTRHVASADLAWSAGPRTTIVVGYHGGRELARDPTLSWREHGPRLTLRVQATSAVRLGLEGALAWRGYDTFDPALSARRRDVVLDLAALAETDLGDRWTLRATLAFRRDASSVPDFTYSKLVPMVGIGYTVGLF
jgi:tetratricopeptide (TPR) repeat protein